MKKNIISFTILSCFFIPSLSFAQDYVLEYSLYKKDTPFSEKASLIEQEGKIKVIANSSFFLVDDDITPLKIEHLSEDLSINKENFTLFLKISNTQNNTTNISYSFSQTQKENEKVTEVKKENDLNFKQGTSYIHKDAFKGVNLSYYLLTFKATPVNVNP